MPTIKNFNKRLEALRSERATFIPWWRELSDYNLAHRGRFLTSDRNKGHKRNTKQINNTSRLANRTLASGMMSGITSPARPWFRLGTGDKAIDDTTAVKHWLYQVQTTMYKIFSSSNTYNSLHQLYAELGVFGMGCMGVYEDFENVINCKPNTVGSYMLGMNAKNENDTMYKEYELSVAQVVKKFGIDNVSDTVKSQWDKGNTEAWVKIVHAIEPNDDRDMMSPKASDKTFRSVYYEGDLSTRDGADKLLRESGFDEYPIVSPRWDVTGDDIYATDCPGMTSLGDTKALQLAERRKYQVLDKIANPPLQGPVSLKDKFKNGTPQGGEPIWHPDGDAGQMTSIYGNYRPDIGAIREEINNVEDRISRSFYEDLFLMLANSDRRQITAREVAEKHEEKLLMLGPVLERLHTELLDPLIDRTFNIAQRSGILPPPPPELQNKELDVEYVSVLAQAQRLVNTGAIDRLTEYVGAIAPIWPEARHKINILDSIDDYAEALGVNPSNINSDDIVNAKVDAEQKAAQQQAMLEQGQQAVDMAKTASETEMDGGNALESSLAAIGQ